MKIPGSNLLGMAARLVSFDTVQHSAWIRNELDGAGREIPKYAQAVPVKASVQPMQRSLYQELGLDLQKNYFTVYTAVPLRDVQRNGSGDMVDFGGRRLSVDSNTDWFLIDGWRGSICVDIGPTPI